MATTSSHKKGFGGMGKKVNKSWVLGVWKLMPLAIWWSTWKERNGWIFEGKARAIDDFKLYFLRSPHDWEGEGVLSLLAMHAL